MLKSVQPIKIYHSPADPFQICLMFFLIYKMGIIIVKFIGIVIWIPFLKDNFIHLFIFLINSNLIFFSFIFISWRLITSQHFSGFWHTLTWISHGVPCITHSDPPSHLPLHPIPLGLPSAPGPSTCLMHPTWAGDLFHYR